METIRLLCLHFGEPEKDRSNALPNTLSRVEKVFLDMDWLKSTESSKLKVLEPENTSAFHIPDYVLKATFKNFGAVIQFHYDG